MRLAISLLKLKVTYDIIYGNVKGGLSGLLRICALIARDFATWQPQDMPRHNRLHSKELIVMMDVVGALIFKDGKLLVCQRPKNKARALLWEFVGGKVENGETREQALKRECKEELDADVEVGELFTQVTHKYADVEISLWIYCSTLKAGSAVKRLEHNDLRWIDVDDIDGYEFCPADVEIVEKIKRHKDELTKES